MWEGVNDLMSMVSVFSKWVSIEKRVLDVDKPLSVESLAVPESSVRSEGEEEVERWSELATE